MRYGIADQINKNKTVKFAVRAGNSTRPDLAEFRIIITTHDTKGWVEKLGNFCMFFNVLFILQHYYNSFNFKNYSHSCFVSL